MSLLKRRVTLAGVMLVVFIGVGLVLVNQSPGVESPSPKLVPGVTLYYGLDVVSDGDNVELPASFVGESSEAFFVIHSTGNESLSVTGFEVTGSLKAEFEEYTGILEPQQARIIKVTFSPVDTRQRTGAFRIQTDDPTTPEINIELTGAGLAVDEPEWFSVTPGADSVTVNWDPVEHVTGYNIHWGTTNETTEVVTDVENPFTLNLPAGQLYYFTVTAFNEYGESPKPDPIWAHPGSIYYLDSINGDDSNNGTSPATAWRSLEKARSYPYQPGDNLLLRRGCVWYGDLQLYYNGTAQHPITVSAYGEGDEPVITNRGEVPGWSNEALWTSHGDNLWSIYYGPWKRAARLWFDGVEKVKAQYPVNLSMAYPWTWDAEVERILVYSAENPAYVYDSIQETGVYSGSSLNVRNVDHHSYRGISFEGGGSAISVTGSNYIEFIDCEIGRDTGSIGIWVSGTYSEAGVKPSEYGLIRWCTVDPWFRQSYPFEKAQTEDGIHMRDNVNHWVIRENIIRDWGHTGVDLFQTREDTTVNYNTVKDCFFTSAHVSYGRAFSTKGRLGGCSYNLFTGNTVANCSVQVQIGGEHNVVTGNIFYGQWTTVVIDYPQGQTLVFNPAMSGDPVYASCNNLVESNIIYNSTGTGIDCQQYGEELSYGNIIRGNTLLKTGYVQHNEFLGVGVKLGNYEDPAYRLVRSEIEVTDNMVFNPDSNSSYWYRGEPMNASTINNYPNEHGDTLSGNKQITATNTELMLTEKMLRFLLQR